MSYEGLYDISFIDDFLGTEFQKRIAEQHLNHDLNDSGQSECKYDAVGLALANLALTEVVVMLFAQIMKAIMMFIYKGLIKGEEWRAPRT